MPYTANHPTARGGRRSGPARAAARPALAAGAPAQRSPSGITPDDPRPRARPRRSRRSARPGRACCASRRWRRRRPGRAPSLQQVAVDPVAGQVDLGLDRRTRAERHHPGDRRQRVQVDPAADLGAERPGVVGDPRRAGQVGRADRVGEPLGRPEPQVHDCRRAGTCPAARPRSSSRAPATAIAIRPNGLMNSTKPASTHHQDSVGAHEQLPVRRAGCSTPRGR